MKSLYKVSIALAFAITHLFAQPTITSFSPTSGPIGTAVTITGTNFSTTDANNIVFFGATKATVTGASTTQLTVTVPAGATYQPISITVGGLTGYSHQPFIVTFPTPASITPGSFASKVDFATGSNPCGVAISDLDGDGKPDLVVINYWSNTVSVLRNTSLSSSITSSSFAAKVDFATGMSPSPWSVAIGDLDGDGKPDLVVVNTGSHTVSVFRNTSTSGSITSSSFAPKVDFTTGMSPNGVAISDIDGDGKPDLVVTNYDDNTVSVLRNTSTYGSITFAAKVDFMTGMNPIGAAIGDIDGDGKPDLVAVNYSSNTVSVLRNMTSSGSISFAANVDFPTGELPYGVAIGDIDGDGKPDLVVNAHSMTASVFWNTSSPGSITSSSFAAKVDFTTGSSPYSVAIGDIDGDGKPDLVVVSANTKTVSAFRNTSTSGSITSSSFAPKVDFTTGAGPVFVAIGDLDGDGKPDLVVTDWESATVSVLRNTVAIVEYTITSTAGPNGSITPSGLGTVNHGGSASFTISPNTNYHIEDVLVDGASVGALSTYLFSNVTALHTIAATFAPDPGTISGSVLVATSGLANVTVTLLDNQMSPISYMVTGASGRYTFSNLTPATYDVMIVEPLGYALDGNPKETILNPGGTNQVNFALTPVTIINDGRGMGYWKQQYDKYITNKGNAQETQAQLNQYIARVHQYYSPHFNAFSGLTTFSQWQAVLSPPNNASMLNKARQQLAALVMNFTSLKIGQSVVVTADGRTAGDVLTYVSILVTGGDASKYELAKNLAEQVCSQQMIVAGVVPAGNVLYKGGAGQQVNWEFDVPAEFSLAQNYPNPFNPSTRISFSLPSITFVSLRVFDAMGRQVATLVSEELSAGNYSRQWNAAGMPSGVYFYRLQAGSFTETKKLVLLR